MKGRIYISFEGMTEAEAVGYVETALNDSDIRKGIIVFKDGTILHYSDYVKNTAISVWRKEK